MSAEVAAYSWRLMDVVATAFGSLGTDLRSVMELSHAT